ncbi:MAG: SDR family oxidoreductase [Armatimonadetes bacterium]|nr:SDR family oxidoreductase [Armatimonadota bacterium]
MSGRTVIVTGASSGIGEATARAFGRAGDRVVLAARRVERLQQLAAELPESLVVPADLTRSEDVARVASEALARYGRIDVLVNNAGLGKYDWLERLPEEDIRAEIAVNLIAPILLTRAVLPAMLAQRRGVVINIGSVAGKIATPTMSIYNATKFGLDGFSEALRREVGPQGVHVCVIYPGPVAGTEFGAKTAKGAGLTAAGSRWRRLPGLRTSTDRVARAIVDLADRPRPGRVVPGVYGVGIAINALLPSLVDLLISRVARRARDVPAATD